MDAIKEENLQLQLLGSSQEEYAAWDNFVDGCSAGTFFHLSGWKTVVEQAFGHKPHYLYAKKQGAVCGVLPLVEQKSAIFGHALISTPFCVYGGVAADDESVMDFLECEAIALAEQLRVDYLELRYPFKRHTSTMQEHCAHSRFGCELGEDSDAILAAVKKKQRAVIRHSLKNNLSYRIDQDVDVAFEVYSESVRNLGTPVFPKSYFKQLTEVFGERVSVQTVEHNQRPVSSVLSFYYKNEVLPYYGGGVFDARALKSNDFMYYQLMCDARLNKACTAFDFGRSKNDSGAYKYKNTWGMTPEPLHYLVHLVKAENLPNLSPNNPKYKMVIGIWKKLPLWLTRRMGPLVSKYLG